MYDLDKFEEEDVIDVQQGHWEVAQTPELIKTTGIGPCAGILVHNPILKKVALSHFVDPIEGPKVPSLIFYLKRGMGEIEDLKVHLAGMGPDDLPPEELKALESTREKLTDFFQSLGIAEEKIATHWNEEGKYTNMYADTETGDVQVVTKAIDTFEDSL